MFWVKEITLVAGLNAIHGTYSEMIFGEWWPVLGRVGGIGSTYLLLFPDKMIRIRRTDASR